MLLVDYQIHDLCESQELVTPHDVGMINPSSINVRLGHEILIHVPEGLAKYDLTKYTSEKPFRLKPNAFALTCTYEYLKLPSNIRGNLKLRSTLAREALAHSLAGLIDNGFQGSLTLELKNYSSHHNIELWYKRAIAQIEFFETDIPDKLYNSEDYQFLKSPKTSRKSKLPIFVK